jgi:hypothetical protein
MQTPQTILLRGGLDLISPQVAMPDGRAIAALNYEPDDTGYTSMSGFERYSGLPSPSDGADATQVADRRAAISEVPGSGPIRGTVVYNGSVLAFRDDLSGGAAMYQATGAGWVQQTFGHTLEFTSGDTEFLEDETVTGGTSGATGTVERVVLTAGAWDGSAEGFLVLSGASGTFQAAETITSVSGNASAGGAQEAIALAPGGVYEFVIHNFYGAAASPRLYMVNGVGTGFEWDGETLAPIMTGIDTGGVDDVLLTAGGPPDQVLTAGGDDIIIATNAVDNPAYIGVYRNHLFLGYAVGAIVFSGPGEPLDFRTIAGAGTFAFGEAMTGMLVASTALLLFGRNRIEYIAGNDVDDFQKLEITSSAGAVLRTPQSAGESPIYMDDAGLRRLSSSPAYGDFKMGTLTRLVEPLFRQKRLAGIVPNTALVVTGKDQYRLFWNDGSGIALYMGREFPEILPFKLPITFFCSCSGELQSGEGDRLFAGAADSGFVYELDRGTSFDGDAIETYIRLAFNSLSSPMQNKAFHWFYCDVVCQDEITIGAAYDVNYGRDEAAVASDVAASAGAPIVTTADNDNVDWTRPVQGQFAVETPGFGRNIAVRLITSSSTARPHTFPSSTISFSARGLRRGSGG